MAEIETLQTHPVCSLMATIKLDSCVIVLTHFAVSSSRYSKKCAWVLNTRYHVSQKTKWQRADNSSGELRH